MEIVKEYIVVNNAGMNVRVILTDTGHYFEVYGKVLLNIEKEKFIEMQENVKSKDLHEQA